MVSQILRMVSQIQAGPGGGRKEYLPPGGGRGTAPHQQAGGRKACAQAGEPLPSDRRLCRIADPCRVAARPSECRCACHDSARTAVGGACRERPVGPGRSGGRTRAAATQLKPSEDSRRSRSPDLGARQRVGGVGPSAARWSRSISSALERCRRLAARQNAAPGGPARPVSGDGGHQDVRRLGNRLWRPRTGPDRPSPAQPGPAWAGSIRTPVAGGRPCGSARRGVAAGS